jgi:hypothetical protein
MISILVSLINIPEGSAFTKVTGDKLYHYHGTKVTVGDVEVLAPIGNGFISSCDGGLKYHGMNLQTLVRVDFDSALNAQSFLARIVEYEELDD